MITKEDADNLLYESKENLVDSLCTQSELIDDLYSQLKKRDEEIERLEALQQVKSCEGCKHHITYITSIGDIESCLIFEKDETLCVRKHRWLDRHEPKEQ